MSIRSTNNTDFINNPTDSNNRIVHELRNVMKAIVGSSGSGSTNVNATQAGAWTVGVNNFPANQVVSGTINATQSGVWSVGVTGALPLPTGAATEVTLSSVNSRLAKGQANMANSLSVTIANDQSAIPVIEQTRIVVTTVIDKTSFKQYLLRQYTDQNGNIFNFDYIDPQTNSVVGVNPVDTIVDNNANKWLVIIPEPADLNNQNDILKFDNTGGIYCTAALTFRADFKEVAEINI